MTSVRALGPAVLLMMLTGCAAATEDTAAARDCQAGNRTYFPVEVKGSPFSGLDEFHCGWFSGHLRSMDEPSLLKRAGAEDAQVYRLMVLPTFHAPHVMRLEPGGADAWRLLERATDGRGGYDPGRVTFHFSRVLTTDEAAKAEAAVAALDLDAMETEPKLFVTDPVTGDERIIIIGDGTTLVLEAVRGGRYRVIHRPWSKSVLEPEFERLVNAFLDLSAYVRRTAESEKSEKSD